MNFLRHHAVAFVVPQQFTVQGKSLHALKEFLIGYGA